VVRDEGKGHTHLEKVTQSSEGVAEVLGYEKHLLRAAPTPQRTACHAQQNTC